ncbi:hypothetical protein ACFE04_012402 [Oxalis oulophora]
MSTGELLGIDPTELKFAFELKKQISCSLKLSNKTDAHVAFKVKTTNPKKYCVRPNTGVVLPRSTCDVVVTMQAQKEAPADMQCKDKFLLQSASAPEGTTVKDITAEMFNKDSGNIVEESKLRVIYVSPPEPPSPVAEESEEGSSPRGSVSDNGNANGSETVARAFADRLEPQEKSAEVMLTFRAFTFGFMRNLNAHKFSVVGYVFAHVFTVVIPRIERYKSLLWNLLSSRLFSRMSFFLEAKALIAKLTEEKNNAIQLNNKLRQELELLKRGSSKTNGGLPFMYVIIIGLIGIVMGYLMKKS